MIASIVLCGTVFLLTILYHRRTLWSSLRIPEVVGLPFLGNLFPVIMRQKTYFQLIEDVYNSAPGSPYVGMYNLTQATLIIRDPDLLETMLRDESSNFEDHGLHADQSDPLSMNLFYLKGKVWKWVRSKLRPSFSTSSMRNIYTEVHNCAEEFLDNFEGKINLRPAMDEFACEVISKAVFCVDSRDGFIEAANEVYNLSGFSCLRVFSRMFFPRTSLAFGVKLVPQRLETFFKEALSKSNRKPNNFLDVMFKLKENEPDFSDEIMLGQFFIFILAGFETTATALTFCLYLLAKHPEVQEKARVEIDNVVEKLGITFDSHKEMAYLDKIINETLRLYTPVTSIVRLSEREYKLPCGAVLPKQTAINLPYLCLHRDPKYFENPLEFKPERWEKRHKVFYPFGFGPRNCIGMQFALLEMKIFLTSFLHKYSITLNSQTVEPLEFDPNSFFIVTKYPILVNVEPRFPNKAG